MYKLAENKLSAVSDASDVDSEQVALPVTIIWIGCERGDSSPNLCSESCVRDQTCAELYM